MTANQYSISIIWLVVEIPTAVFRMINYIFFPEKWKPDQEVFSSMTWQATKQVYDALE